MNACAEAAVALTVSTALVISPIIRFASAMVVSSSRSRFVATAPVVENPFNIALASAPTVSTCDRTLARVCSSSVTMRGSSSRMKTSAESSVRVPLSSAASPASSVVSARAAREVTC